MTLNQPASETVNISLGSLNGSNQGRDIGQVVAMVGSI
jgi:hypothetical protein